MRENRDIRLLEAMLSINKHKRPSQLLPLLQILQRLLAPGLPASCTIARHIHNDQPTLRKSPPHALLPALLRCRRFRAPFQPASNPEPVHRLRAPRPFRDVRGSLFCASEEGVEEAALADVAAAEERDFWEAGRWEGAEVGGAEEDAGCGGVEECRRILELLGVGCIGDGVGVQCG